MSVLRSCTIENFGLIEHAQVAFADGLTAFTGETGSGKTMLLGALGFVLGDRASADDVRAGSERARVSLVVEADDALREALERDGFGMDADEDAIFSRELSASGKSAARINGRPATSAQVRALCEALVDFVGQHEHQRLLSAPYQRDVLDRFAGEAALVQRARVARAHGEIAALDEAIEALERSGRQAGAEAEFARFALAEIDGAQLSAGEEDALRERRDYLANVERIATALRAAHAALEQSESSATDALGAAAAALGGVARYGDDLARLHERAAALQSEAGELAVALARELDRADFDPAEAERVGGRLDLVERLKRKYGGSVEAVLAERERLAAGVEAFSSLDERLAGLRADRAALAAERADAARRLGELREAAAVELERGVTAELAALAMRNARFAVAFERLAEPTATGNESVQYVLSPNKGEPMRPLGKVASGGELSRILLALAVVLADKRDAATLVFDEIDAGVGGATAAAVGTRLGALAKRSQVVCVTHLAQIASWAAGHYALRKRDRRGGTAIEAVALDAKAAVVEELARMLSGSTSDVALQHAGQLLAATEAGAASKGSSRPR